MPRMGDIADVYSAFDVPLEQTYDRRLDQTWPGQLAQDAIGAVLAPGRALQSTEPITTEQMIKPAADLAGLVTGGSYAAPAQKGASGAGIRAYHSSPHDFDKFDLAKIGSGEGAQVYGHGLYFAESPAVSGQGGQYWQQFKNKFEGPEKWAADYLQKAGFDRKEALEILKKEMWPPNSPSGLGAMELLKGDKPVGPRTYEVNINADPAHFLDWDKPLREQPAVTERLIGGAKHPEDWVPNPDVTGSKYWATTQGAPHHRSDFMRERGIPGIKYLDQGSRAFDSKTLEELNAAIKQSRMDIAKETDPSALQYFKDELAMLEKNKAAVERPTHNYVVFDSGIIDIMKKYAVPGAIGAGGMGALAAQDNYQQ